MGQADTTPTRSLAMPPTELKSLFLARAWPPKTNIYSLEITRLPYDIAQEKVKNARLEDTELHIGISIACKSAQIQTVNVNRPDL
jgi:hypothetical protein